MVVPGVGLMYPTIIDYSIYIPTPNYNYSNLTGKRYFCRRFYSENSNRKFGGIFVFEGITSKEFMQKGLDCQISKDNGSTWLTLKEYREGDADNGILTDIADIDAGDADNGILTDIADIDAGCAIQFAFNEDESVCGNIGLLFKLSFEPNVKSIIKRITLNNISNTGKW